jgi:hypothetical protein
MFAPLIWALCASEVVLIETSLVGKAALTKTFNLAVSSYRKKRFDRIITALTEGDISISQAEFESDSFISCFLKTNEAIDKATSNEKIGLLMQVFLCGINSNLISKLPDLYHEAITIFSELSYREVLILDIAKNHLPFSSSNEGERVGDKNKETIDKIASKLGIQEDLAYVLLSRLQRTGFIIDSAMLGNQRYFYKTAFLNEIYSYLDLQLSFTGGA